MICKEEYDSNLCLNLGDNFEQWTKNWLIILIALKYKFTIYRKILVLQVKSSPIFSLPLYRTWKDCPHPLYLSFYLRRFSCHADVRPWAHVPKLHTCFCYYMDRPMKWNHIIIVHHTYLIHMHTEMHIKGFYTELKNQQLHIKE